MTFLSDELLARIHERAAGYDRDNRFFTEDLDDLVAAGYLRALVPARFGGLGMSLREVAHEQAALAAAAPATALAINMHLVWTGVAKTLPRPGRLQSRLRARGGGRGRDLRLRDQRARQ